MDATAILIQGIIQGVGFRPFIYNLAKQFHYKGYVKNTAKGVKIVVDTNDVSLFLHEIQKRKPQLAKITHITTTSLSLQEPFEDFFIFHTQEEKEIATILLGDIAICQECKKELFDFTSKRYHYPFINCTNCGPRYSIIKNLPYDRIQTAMANFKMCGSCKKEYENPNSRMFHAQPIGCNECGVELFLYHDNKTYNHPLKKVVQLLQNGFLGAIKGVGGFRLVCDATNEKLLKRLRQEKRRISKPFAIVVRDITMAKKFAYISKKEEKVLCSKEAPIVLLKKKNNTTLAHSVAPNIDKIGIMIASNPLDLLLFEYIDFPLVATSANLSKEPIIITATEIEKKLGFVDFVLDYNREIINPIDDSVVEVIDDTLKIIRLARGYAPLHIKLPKKIDQKILALGANQKATIAIVFDDNLIISPYIADLDSIASIEHFKQMIKNFQRFYKFEFDVVLHDKHPSYESTKIAITIPAKKRCAIQHHKAHIASIFAENIVSKEYVAFAFDGTGYGDDGTLWGGEIFVNKERKYYFQPIKLLGGEKAIKECYRVALSLLFEQYTLEEILELDLAVIKQYKTKIPLLYKMYQQNIQVVLSSSVGRLFDMACSIADISHLQSYEGEAGLLTEAHIKELNRAKKFPYNITNGVVAISYDFLCKDFLDRFYATLCDIVITIAKKEQKTVLLTGGVWQNKTLFEFVATELKKEKIVYKSNSFVPINDSGISVGQIMEYING